ncbi:MAG: ATP-dependent DNA ligase [Candidatus Hydrogenedentes bacterium]|nr:ATP-dependent DNA ligase [Candidatus Hydrogenedentota bacterium]
MIFQQLPIKYPLPAMEAASVAELPEAGDWIYEPKWDGFRCLAWKDDGEVRVQSKAEKPLGRYFPEIAEAIAGLKADACVLDGELVVPDGKQFSFDLLLQRIHPAESRVQRLAAESPALFVVFDLLVDEHRNSIHELPMKKRRVALEQFFKRFCEGNPHLCLSPSSTDPASTRQWLKKSGNALDGIICKHGDLPYRSGERDGMSKVKFLKTADCVVGGFRYSSAGKGIGSLLLGLYDEDGLLHHVGHCTASGRMTGKDLRQPLEKLREAPGFSGKSPGGPSRWSQGRDAAWEPLRPDLVIEVEYDHVTGGRFRHGTRFLRWRPDKRPDQCRMEQIHMQKGKPLALLK